jgi:quercetin dioxygenase-like cupin family protein
MPHVVKEADLPRLRSVRDTRDRLDLVNAALFGVTDLKADRITYHPGDTAAAHRHPGSKHFFFVTEGEGVLRVDDATHELAQGDVAMVLEDEVHWFENDSDADFEFIELWVPAPAGDTVWASDDQ